MGQADIAIVGLGTMGSALALNIAEHGFEVAVHNRTPARIDALVADAGALADRLTPAPTLEETVASLKKPRSLLLMVPAGDPVDQQIEALLPLLDEGDLIIDGGNSSFHDSERRGRALEAAGKRFIGLGVSGGEDGARHGPSLMGGGSAEAWEQAAPILTAIAADFKGEPCAQRLGPSGAGHFVKMVHNGIEYADMQMIAEAYGVMRDGLGRSASEIASRFAAWNEGPLQSYLIEISVAVLSATDPETSEPMLDVIVDRAGQKGTGRWTLIEAHEFATPVPVIEAAVMARNLSARLDLRKAAAVRFGSPARSLRADALADDDIESALIAGKIACYAQGFALLADGAAAEGWDMAMPDVARVWRAGCIIRSAMLDDMAEALAAAPGESLLMAPFFADLMVRHAPGLRRFVTTATAHGLPVPALCAALNWFDMMATERSTANMIQAQRDFFGAHGFERFDAEGSHHGCSLSPGIAKKRDLAGSAGSWRKPLVSNGFVRAWRFGDWTVFCHRVLPVRVKSGLFGRWRAISAGRFKSASKSDQNPGKPALRRDFKPRQNGQSAAEIQTEVGLCVQPCVSGPVRHDETDAKTTR